LTPSISPSYTSPTMATTPIQIDELRTKRSEGSSAAALWWSAAAVALIAGYADLWRGGETIAPILLVVGYCILVPIAILKR
jgi:hypothetical protein